MNQDELKLRETYAIYFQDVDPDTGLISQMKPVAYTEFEFFAKEIAELMNKYSAEAKSNPLRIFKHTKIF